MVAAPPALPSAFYSDPQFLDQSGRTLVCAVNSKADQARVHTTVSKTWRLPLSSLLQSTIKTPNPSSGPKARTKSLKTSADSPQKQSKFIPINYASIQ